MAPSPSPLGLRPPTPGSLVRLRPRSPELEKVLIQQARCTDGPRGCRGCVGGWSKVTQQVSGRAWDSD